jgi:hypothetical protein
VIDLFVGYCLAELHAIKTWFAYLTMYFLIREIRQLVHLMFVITFYVFCITLSNHYNICMRSFLPLIFLLRLVRLLQYGSRATVSRYEDLMELISVTLVSRDSFRTNLCN